MFQLNTVTVSYSQTPFAPSYGVEDNLAQSQVFSIIQDNKGRIWAGTIGGGISIFDGKEFTNLTIENGLSGNKIYSLFCDKKGKIWIGTNNGLNCYSDKNIIKFKYKSSPESIWKITQTKEGKILLATSKGISVVEGDSVKPYKIDSIIDENIIYTIFQDSQENLWCGTRKKGLYIINKDSVINLTKSDGLCDDNVRIILEDKDQNIWIGTDKGINVFFDNHLKTYDEHSTQTYTAAVLDSEGEIWFSNYNGWIEEYNTQNIRTVKKLTAINYYRLKKRRIWTFYRDPEKTFWIGTETGLIKFPETPFTNFNMSNDKLHDDNIYSISQIDSNKMMIGAYSSKHGISELTFNNFDLLTTYNSDSVKIIDFKSDDRVFGIAKDKDNNIWVGTLNGFSKIDQRGKITNYSPDKNKNFTQDTNITSKYTNYFYKDNEGTIWAATYNGITQIKDGKFINYNKICPNLKGKVITYIYKDSKNRIWLPSNDTSIFVLENNKLTDFTTENKFPNLTYRSVVEDYQHNFWIAAGPYVLYYNGIKYDTISSKDGLIAQQVYLLIIDDHNNLFVGTNGGISKIDLMRFYSENKIFIKQYGYQDGFMGKECNRNVVMKDSQGRFWFDTVKGATVYDPQKDLFNNLKPKVSLTDIQVNYKEPDWSLYTKVNDSISNLPFNAELPYTLNNFHFSFVSNSLKIPNKVKFKYQLIPLDNDWSPPFSKNELDFKSLPPNHYTLKIVSCNDDGVWSEEPMVFSFTIKPPFWQTWWFYTIVIVVALALIYLYIKVRERKLQRDKQKLEKTVAERTAEVQEKNEILLQANEEITAQRDEIVHQRDKIEAQRDLLKSQKETIENIYNEVSQSIDYATRLQQSILPNTKVFEKHFSDSFIFFKPKDKVSGDFYWWAEVENQMIITAADCTGHGVPGAFMSMLGVSFLREIVAKEYITHPGVILRKLRKEIIKSLGQKGESGEQKDGMDMSLVSINLENLELQFAGANNPLYVIKKEKLEIENEKIILNSDSDSKFFYEVKPDKMPIAIYEKMDKFTTHTFKLEKGDSLYLFSDGYADQFGGNDNKKFKYKPFKELLLSNSEKPMSEQRQIIEKAFNEWKGNNDQIDDVTVLGIKI